VGNGALKMETPSLDHAPPEKASKCSVRRRWYLAVDLATMIAALFIVQWPEVAGGSEMLY